MAKTKLTEKELATVCSWMDCYQDILGAHDINKEMARLSIKLNQMLKEEITRIRKEKKQ